ncbi:GAP1-N2 domain-containing protein [Mycolicibacterium mageritense]|uniref:GAP1-N2 domain-containing protein n=1 Tax=Mycolicibacterium mageritense TaxID=53462 RepID=UPI001E4AD43C|nr:hypothetical protein [Mycolicibacterium mageritense]GJJ19648.1 putative ESX-1 scaffolding and assembly protein SaeB [Mycolicibacterium mageritense]
MTARYGQLAYTSFDAVGSAGGWQVKQTTGAPTPDEIQQLIAGVRTVFRPLEPMPAYPTPEQLEQGPRRLAYGRLEGEAVALWHTVPAGSDSTGRPGNVFAHVVLDRTPFAAPQRRPIEWWRSPQWVRPFGAAAVGRATIADSPPAPGDVVTKDSVVAFALDTRTWRLATLFALLDAVAAALDGGPPVVLGVESPDSAAQWIGLVSFLMSAGTAAQLTFSTFDRADQVMLALHGGQLLTAVPLADLDAVPAGVAVISETESVWLGELGAEPHRTAGGHRIDVTPWSAMAQVTLLDPHSARRLLDDIDRISEQVVDRGLHPAWPMAMAVAGRREFADAEEEAHDVIAAHSPPDVPTDSAAAATISAVLSAAVGTSTADAWRAVQELPDGPAAEFADATYLSRAIADDVWLGQIGPIPLGPRLFHGKPIPPQLLSAIGPALETAREHGSERVLRVVELLLRAGITDARLNTALLDDVLPVLDDPDRGARLRQRVDVDGRLALATAALQSGGDVEASAISDGLLDWFADATPMPAAGELAYAQPWDRTWIRAALRGIRAGRGGRGDQGAWLWWLRATSSPQLEQTIAGSVWDPADLLLALGGDPVPGTAAVRTLLGAPDSQALGDLANKVIDDNGDSLVVACAAVRAIEPRAWMQQRYVETHQSAYGPLWEQAMLSVEPGVVHRDFEVRVLTFGVLGVIAGQPYPPVCNVLAEDAGVGGDALVRVHQLVDGYEIAPHVVLAISSLNAVAAEDVGQPLTPVDVLVQQLAERVGATLPDDDATVDGIIGLMIQMSGDGSDATQRRYRKMVSRLLARRADTQPSLAARLRGSR